jgi:Mrp family chromosome partitioning ATPase
VDTRLIAQNADTVIISVLRDTSRVPQVRSACEFLEKFAVPVLGVVITGSKGDAYPDSSYQQYVDAQAV